MLKQTVIFFATLFTLSACCHTEQVTPNPDSTTPVDSFYVTGPEQLILKNNISDTSSSLININNPSGDMVKLMLDPLAPNVTGKFSSDNSTTSFNTKILIAAALAKPGLYTQHFTVQREGGTSIEYPFNVLITPSTNSECAAYFYTNLPETGSSKSTDGVTFLFDAASQQIYISYINISLSTNGMGGLLYAAATGEPEVFMQVNCNEYTITIPETLIEVQDVGYSSMREYFIKGSGTIDPATKTFKVEYTLKKINSNTTINKKMSGKLDI